MFEDEIAMEKRSSILPALLMLSLVVLIGGFVTYVILQFREKTPPSPQQVSAMVAAALQGPGPAVIHFRTGLVKNDEKLPDPNYRLLEKAGIVKLAKAAAGSVVVSLTPDGEGLLTGLPGLKKSQEKDGSFSYQAPLAERQLLSIGGITPNGDNGVIVEYTWKWVPNQLGNAFDAGGPLVKSFSVWERQTLINKYGVDFYNAGPTKSTLALVRTDRGWRGSAQ
ncbi:MAG: hypothetical protein ABSG40_05385 [Terriglobales bacterium]|jgi:hypothetical protein